MRILYFGWVRSRIGTAEEDVELPGDVGDVAALMEHLKARGGGYARAFENAAVVRAAVNQEIAPPGAPVADGDEVAFFPPMTGG